MATTVFKVHLAQGQTAQVSASQLEVTEGCVFFKDEGNCVAVVPLAEARLICASDAEKEFSLRKLPASA